MAATLTARASGTAYVVLDDAARVIAVFWGADAPDEALDWAERGYRVESVDASLIA